VAEERYISVLTSPHRFSLNGQRRESDNTCPTIAEVTKKLPPLSLTMYSPSIIRMIKSRRMKWAGHVVRMGAKRSACRILVGMPEGRTTRKTKT
jgi:hypothetical protein